MDVPYVRLYHMLLALLELLRLVHRLMLLVKKLQRMPLKSPHCVSSPYLRMWRGQDAIPVARV